MERARSKKGVFADMKSIIRVHSGEVARFVG
jgi:hypothetical protein